MPEPTDYAKRFVKGGTVVFVALVVAGFIGIFMRMFLWRSFGVYDYGLFFLVFELVSFISLFRDLGLNTALAKHIPEFMLKRQFGKVRSSMATVVLIQALVALPITILLFVFSDQVAMAVAGTLNASIIIRILALWFFLMVFYHVFRLAFQGFQDMKTYAIMEVLYILVTFFMVFSLVGIFNFGVEGVAFGFVVSAAILVSSWVAIFRMKYPFIIKDKLRIERPLIKKLLLFAMPLLLSGMGGIVLYHTDTIMIGIFRNPREVALYQTAQPLTFLLSYFTVALCTVLLPMTSELWAKREKKLLNQALHFLVKFSFMFILPAALVFMIFPNIVISSVATPNYLAAALALQILSAMIIVSTLWLILQSLAVGIGQPMITTKTIGAMAGLNFIANLLFIPLFGFEGAATTTFISSLAGLFLIAYFLRKFIRFTLPTTSLLKTIVAGGLMVVFIIGLKSVVVLHPWWLEFFVVIIPSLVFYSLLILAMKAIRKRDVDILKGAVPMPKWMVRIVERIARD